MFIDNGNKVVELTKCTQWLKLGSCVSWPTVILLKDSLPMTVIIWQFAYDCLHMTVCKWHFANELYKRHLTNWTVCHSCWFPDLTGCQGHIKGHYLILCAWLILLRKCNRHLSSLMAWSWAFNSSVSSLMSISSSAYVLLLLVSGIKDLLMVRHNDFFLVIFRLIRLYCCCTSKYRISRYSSARLHWFIIYRCIFGKDHNGVAIVWETGIFNWFWIM